MTWFAGRETRSHRSCLPFKHKNLPNVFGPKCNIVLICLQVTLETTVKTTLMTVWVWSVTMVPVWIWLVGTCVSVTVATRENIATLR